MSRRTTSPEEKLIPFFTTAPMETAEALLRVIQAIVKARREHGTLRISKRKAQEEKVDATG